MSYWEKRNNIEDCPTNWDWYNYQGRVEDKQSNPSHHQQQDNAKYKAIPAKRQFEQMLDGN